MTVGVRDTLPLERIFPINTYTTHRRVNVGATTASTLTIHYHNANQDSEKSHNSELSELDMQCVGAHDIIPLHERLIAHQQVLLQHLRIALVVNVRIAL